MDAGRSFHFPGCSRLRCNSPGQGWRVESVRGFRPGNPAGDAGYAPVAPTGEPGDKPAETQAPVPPDHYQDQRALHGAPKGVHGLHRRAAIQQAR